MRKLHLARACMEGSFKCKASQLSSKYVFLDVFILGHLLTLLLLEMVPRANRCLFGAHRVPTTPPPNVHPRHKRSKSKDWPKFSAVMTAAMPGAISGKTRCDFHLNSEKKQTSKPARWWNDTPKYQAKFSDLRTHDRLGLLTL